MYEEIIKDNISYDILKSDLPHDGDRLDEIVDLILETVCTRRKTKGKNAKKYRKGEEYGSARWGGPKDIAPYIDPVFDNNILLTQTERLTMNNRPKDPKTARNKNVLVIGGSGSGKTRFFVKPSAPVRAV